MACPPPAPDPTMLESSDRGELVLVRHGETEWSASGRHTSFTDLELTTKGCDEAHALAARLAGRRFAAVFTSPSRRARGTCALAGLTPGAAVDDDLVEWGYGAYEGLTTSQIRETIPDWTIFTHDPPGGETAEQIGRRADRVIARAVAAARGGDVALFSHGHFLRVLGARWVGLPARDGARLGLDTATIGVLGYEHDDRVVRVWEFVISGRRRTSRPTFRAFAVAGMCSVALLCAACGGGGGSDGQRSTTTTNAPSSSTTAGTTTRPSVTTPAGSVQAVTAPWKLPAAVARQIVVANGGRLEIVGGLDATKFSTASVVLVDPATGTSQPGTKLAEAVHDAAGSLIGGSVFVFGGGGPSENGTADVQSVPSSGPATIVGRLPGPCSDNVATTVGNRTYVLGGYDGAAIVPGVLSTADGTTFETVGNLPVPVRYPAFVVVGKVIYLFGGVANSLTGTDTNAVQTLDTTNGVIATVAQLPTSLSHASAVVLGGKVYLLGGYVNNSTLSDQILRFDPATRTTTVVGKLPAALSDAAAAVVGDKGYLVGGQGTDRNPVSSVVVITAN